MNNILPQFTTFSVEKRIGKTTNWDPQTKPSDFVAGLLGVEEPIIVPPGYVPKVKLPLPPPNARFVEPNFQSKYGPSPLDKDNRGELDDGQITAPQGVLVVKKPKPSTATKDLLQYLKIENGSSRSIDVFIQTPFSIKNIPLRGQGVLVKDLTANAKLKTIPPTPQALAAQAMLANSLTHQQSSTPDDSSCFCLYTVPTKQLVITMTGKQEIQNFNFANGPIGMQVEVVEEFDRKVLACTRVVPGSQAYAHASKLTNAQIVAVNGHRVVTLSEFQCTVAVAKETVGCIVITALIFKSDKAREDSLTAHKLKRNKSVQQLFQGIMRGGALGGMGSPETKKKASLHRTSSTAAKESAKRNTIHEGEGDEENGGGGGGGDDDDSDDSDSDDDDNGAPVAKVDEEDEEDEDDILTRRHRQQRAIAAKIAEHTVNVVSRQIGPTGAAAAAYAGSLAARTEESEIGGGPSGEGSPQEHSPSDSKGRASPSKKGGVSGRRSTSLFGEDDSDESSEDGDGDQDMGGYTATTVHGLHDGAEKQHQQHFNDDESRRTSHKGGGGEAQDDAEDDGDNWSDEEEGGLMAKVKKPAARPVPLPVEDSLVVEVPPPPVVAEEPPANTFLTGTGAEVAPAQPSVASSSLSEVFSDLTPFRALICPPKLIIDKVSTWGRPSHYCQFQNFSTFWKVCVYWVDEENTLVLRKTLYPFDEPHVDMISSAHAWVLTVSKLKETKLASIRAKLKDRMSGAGSSDGAAVAAVAADVEDEGEDEEESVDENDNYRESEDNETVEGDISAAVSNTLNALGAVAAGGSSVLNASQGGSSDKNAAGGKMCNRYCLAYRPSDSILQSSKSTNIVWLPSESLTVAQRMRPTSSLYKVPVHHNRFHPLMLRQTQTKQSRRAAAQQAAAGTTMNYASHREKQALAQQESNYHNPNVCFQIFDTKQLKASGANPITPPGGAGANDDKGGKGRG